MSELLRNTEFVWAVMATLIFAITFVIKIPYKKLTSKIKNESVKKVANKAIILFAFGIGFALYFAYCHFFGVAFDFRTGLVNPMTAIVAHSILERAKKKEDKVFDTEEGQEIIGKVTEFIKGNSEKDDKKSTDKKKQCPNSDIAEFWKAVKK